MLYGRRSACHNFPDGSSSADSCLVALGTGGDLFRHHLRRQPPAGFGERTRLWSFQNRSPEASALDGSRCCFDARHLRIIVSPTNTREAELGNFSAALKRWIRRELKPAWNWQPGCSDRLLRSDESLREKWLYVQDNPVRAGLVGRATDWPYRIELDD